MSPTIALVGRPNVGKSSLFNRLLRRSAALVDDRPGVTRDRNFAHLAIEGREGLLIDTGGFEAEGPASLPGRVSSQVMSAVKESDLVLFVTDGQSGPHPGDAEMARMLRRSAKSMALVVNKIDGPGKMAAASEFYELGLEPVLAVSAAHGYGLEDLRRLLWESLEPAGQRAGDAVRVAVIGRPNAGKSSLVNRLCGEERLVVHERPGTTRDAIDVDIERGERRYTLVDTAGVRRKGRVSQKLEKLSVMRAIKGIEGSDVAVLAIDALEGFSDQDAHIAGYAHERGRPLIILINKWDAVKERLEARKELKRELELKMAFLDKAPVLTVSALTGSGLNKLLPLVDRIMEQYRFRAKTHEVNEVFEKACAAHAPPQAGKVRLKFYYATQISSRPPTFVAFANRPDSVHFSYRRFLVNQLKKAFGLDLVPVRLHIRDRHDEEARGPRGGKGAKASAKSKTATKAAAKTAAKAPVKAKAAAKEAPKAASKEAAKEAAKRRSAGKEAEGSKVSAKSKAVAKTATKAAAKTAAKAAAKTATKSQSKAASGEGPPKSKAVSKGASRGPAKRG